MNLEGKLVYKTDKVPIFKGPVAVYGKYMHNYGADQRNADGDKDNTGWIAGAQIGKMGKAGDAMLKVEIGDELSAEESEALSKVISSLTAAEEPEVSEEAAPAEPEVNSALLELKKKKLELLLKGIQ